MNYRSGVLTAGGSPVHRIHRPETTTADDKPQQPDTIPIIERYTDLAKQIHRVAVAPRNDRWLVGCSCGWVIISKALSSAKVSIEAQQHVVDEAEKLYNRLEQPEGDWD